MARSTRGLPGRLASGARRFESWRQKRTTRRIPEELWSLASSLAARFGVSRTARALRVQYYDLKKRVEQAATAESNGGERSAFVEILTEPPTSIPEFLVEVENACGDKMRIHMKAAHTPDLAELCKRFVEQRS